MNPPRTSISFRDRLLIYAGFDPGNAEDRLCFSPAAWLAVALACLPLMLLFSLDADRCMSLAFLPAVWAGWKITKPARLMDMMLLSWALAAMLVSTVFSDHCARALVMVSAVGWTIAGGLVARNLANCTAAVRLVLAGMLGGGVIGVLLVQFGVGVEYMFFPTYWSARLFGAHQFAACWAALGLLAMPTASSLQRALLATAALIVWTGLAWSGSRAPALGLAVGLAVWFCLGSSTDRRFLLRWAPALAICAMALSYQLGTPYPQLGWWDALNRTAEAQGLATVTSGRTDFWGITWREIIGSPWIGRGADSYLYIQPTLDGKQPHNVLLQWMLEYGVFGSIPLVLLIIRGVVSSGFARRETKSGLYDHRVWSCAALVGTAVYSLFDGVFYHMIIFMPAAVLAGLAFGQSNPSGSAHRVIKTHAPGRILLLIALLSLLLHNWLCLMLLRAQNITPDSLPPRILRVFPSASHGLSNWIERWRRSDPDVVMPWIQWAEQNATDPQMFHVYAAQLHIWAHNYPAAIAELEACLPKVHHTERAATLTAIQHLRELEAKRIQNLNTPAASPPLPAP
jgi:O-antigen ligase